MATAKEAAALALAEGIFNLQTTKEQGQELSGKKMRDAGFEKYQAVFEQLKARSMKSLVNYLSRKGHKVAKYGVEVKTKKAKKETKSKKDTKGTKKKAA